MVSSELNSSAVSAPLVSVAMTSFNSANWLSRALDSVLKQRTNFPIEIVIGDDCSQDSTISIAHSYREKHPNLIRVLERPKNLGMQRNYYEIFEVCRGRFIAWLDSDDYWTDSEKLAIQAGILESDSSVSACCHFVREVTADGRVKREKTPVMPAGRYGLEALLRCNFVPSASAMFRSGIHRQLPPWYFDLAPITDWPIWVLSAVSGDIVLIDRVMADYHLTPNSAFTGQGALFAYKMDAEFYEKVESILPAKWHRVARKEKFKRYESLAYWLRKQGDFTDSRKAAVKAFCSPYLMDVWGSKTKGLVAAIVREAQWRLRGTRAAG
jgi:glycosyltransferase involved in cell wall biosynthesis